MMIRRPLPRLFGLMALAAAIAYGQQAESAANPAQPDDAPAQTTPASSTPAEQAPAAATNELSAELLGKLQIASQHVRANQPREAIAVYTEFLTARTDLFSAYLDRGKAYHGLKEYAKAIADYTAALKLKTDLAEAYLQRCIAHYEVGNHGGAIEDCDKYIASKPRNMIHEPLYYKGMALAAYKKYTEAIDTLNKAFEINNNLTDAHMLLGRIYAEQDQLLFALREYSVVIQQLPGHKEALKLRAAVKASLGDEVGSQEDLAKSR